MYRFRRAIFWGTTFCFLLIANFSSCASDKDPRSSVGGNNQTEGGISGDPTNDSNYPDYTDEHSFGELAIMQGATSDNETQIFILTKNKYNYYLINSQNEKFFPIISTGDYPNSEWKMEHLFFQGLAHDTSYIFRVASSFNNKVVDERELKTLKHNQQNLKFAFTSCMDDDYSQDDIWQQMVAQNPDVIFLIGDNVYADTEVDIATPSILWKRYVKTRSYIELFRFRKLIPVIATWDDHDYGTNNADLHYPHKEESLRIFKKFFGSKDTNNFQMSGIGTSSVFSIFGYDFFLLDNRFYRTTRGIKPQWHFGAEQSQWLWDNIQHSERAFIVSGDQFFGGYSAKDSFEGHHPKRFKKFINKIKTFNIKIAFMSGDRHYTEIMEIPNTWLGYITYEFTASPMHAKTRSLFLFPNSKRVEGEGGDTNFMLISADSDMHLHATSYTVGGEILYTGEYHVAR